MGKPKTSQGHHCPRMRKLMYDAFEEKGWEPPSLFETPKNGTELKELIAIVEGVKTLHYSSKN